MAVHKLILDTFEDDYYELIAIHCSLPSYRLAFLLNKTLKLNLSRNKEDICFDYSNATANYALYQHEDHHQYYTYSFFENKSQTEEVSRNDVVEELFYGIDTVSTMRYLIPELKQVDYFFKIETELSDFLIESLLDQLSVIPQIITSYRVDYTRLKSKNNLIFE